jgi:hypothetical protein
MNRGSFAMMHAAIHDALNAIERRSQPYALDAQAPAGSSPEAAVAAAAHDVLLAVFPQLPSNLGLTPAAAILVLREADGSDALFLDFTYVPESHAAGLTSTLTELEEIAYEK